MGSLFGRHWLSGTGVISVTAEANPLPRPDRFEVARTEEIGGLWVASVRYPGAVHHEGLKTLVLRKDPRTLAVLDPHFLPDELLVARFAPGAGGYDLATCFARMLERGEF